MFTGFRALNIQRTLIRQLRKSRKLAALTRDFRESHSTRLAASKAQQAGCNSGRTGQSGRLGFAAGMGKLSEMRRAVLAANRALLDGIEIARMSRSYKLLVMPEMNEARI